jgi:crotonobetainyl-CoA:carnitine CoA-transferase CaiB-like acyl-CoA transferase
LPGEARAGGHGGALEGLKVVERADGVSGPYCGKLLADLGAEVVKIETPGTGDRARRMAPFFHDEPGADSGLLFNALNTNKLGVSLDLTTPVGSRLLTRLLEGADVFLFGGETREIEAQGIRYEALSQAKPRLVGVYITPFGLTGPKRGWRGSELVSFQGSGLGFATPGEKDIPKHCPPLKAGGHQALMTAGLTAAAAVMHALFALEATGAGQRVDVSEVEPLASFQFMELARWTYAGDPGKRGVRDFGQRIRCKDGEFNIMFMQDHMWQAWVDVMGNPDWACRAEFDTQAGRTEHQREIAVGIAAWAAERTKEEIYRLGQGRRVPVFPLNSIGDAVESAQVQSRGFLRELPLACGVTVTGPTAPYRFSATPWTIRRAAPRLGEHNREILCGRLGLPPDELVAAYAAGHV